MDKREEIREGIHERVGNALIEIGCGGGGCPKAEMQAIEAQGVCVDEILKYLDSMKVVMIADTPLPSAWNTKGELMTALIYKQKLEDVGCVVTERLV